jgi:methyl-accepting chemotaxis protein
MAVWQGLTLRTKMLISICSISFLTFAFTILMVSWKAGAMAKTEAMNTAQEVAYRYAQTTKSELDAALDAARTLAQAFEGFKRTGFNPDRANVNDMLQSIVEKNPQFLAVWSCWEENGFDGMDPEYANLKGSDATGRYIPYWNRGSGKVDVTALVDYEKPGVGDYYLIPKKSKKEAIINPQQVQIGGKEVLKTSVGVPVVNEEEFFAVVGVDIAMASLQEMVEKIKPYETGSASLIANNLTYAAHPDATKVSADIGSNGIWAEARKKIQTGEAFSATDTDEKNGESLIRIFVPVKAGRTLTPWSFLVNVPEEKVLAKAKDIRNVTIMIGIISVLVMFGVVFLVAQKIASPLKRVAEGMSRGAEQVSGASAEVSGSSQQMAEGASEQASSLEETSSSLEEMASMIKQNADNAKQANLMANNARSAAEQSRESMKKMSEAITKIKGSSDETAKIVKTIDEIAFQTNLLALNAAVEAARAGEAGKGFAVVAEEVRNLAQRCAQAAKNTAALIEDSQRNAGAGVAATAEVEAVLKQIAGAIEKVTQLIGEVSAASEEQARGIEQVNTSVAEMDKITQSNAANAEEIASASEELSAQAIELMSIVGTLVTLVRGSKGIDGFGGEETVAAAAPQERKFARRAEVPELIRPARKAAKRPVAVRSKEGQRSLAEGVKKEVKPEEVIPFDDDELKEF